jgi:nicotinamide-nucleotide amidase
MPANNQKQAMLPENAEFIDNPIGTACGFAVTIGKARFWFTPGVPREMRRMLDEQVIPRLLKLGGITGQTRLKRFHSFGIGESRADELLAGIPGLAGDGQTRGEIKLGFQAHYPQLETKLAARGSDEADLQRKLAPIEAEVRRRLGNFVIAEDDQTLEGVILDKLTAGKHTLAIAETLTGGQIAARLSPLVGAETVFRRGVVARDLADSVTPAAAAGVAAKLRQDSGASHALAVLMQLDEGNDRPDFGAVICVGIADAKGAVSRQARLVGGRDWVRIGAAELGLDCLRRHLLGLPVDERVDFERR